MADDAIEAADRSFLVLGILFLAIWLCTTAGAWAALRLLRDRVAWRTTFMVATGILAWSVVSLPSLFWSLEKLPSEAAWDLAGGVALAAMLTIPPALAARWIILENEKMSGREENPT